MFVDFDGERRVIVVNGVGIALEVLEWLTKPDEDKFYRFFRRGNVVTVHCYCYRGIQVIVDPDLQPTPPAAL
jgi:hypothetical protein